LTKKSAMKDVRVASRRRDANKSTRSAIKTNITKAEKLIVDGDVKAAEAAVKTAVVSLDKAAEKQILHANNAARRKSRLLKKLNQAKVKPAAAAAEKPAA
jgi:small subunit ribosomal protein S20